MTDHPVEYMVRYTQKWAEGTKTCESPFKESVFGVRAASMAMETFLEIRDWSERNPRSPVENYDPVLYVREERPWKKILPRSKPLAGSCYAQHPVFKIPCEDHRGHGGYHTWEALP